MALVYLYNCYGICVATDLTITAVDVAVVVVVATVVVATVVVVGKRNGRWRVVTRIDRQLLQLIFRNLQDKKFQEILYELKNYVK